MRRFMERGYVVWLNPFNRFPTYVSFRNTRAIVFWTKDPRPIMPRLHELDGRQIGYYFQYTLNDYEDLGCEPNIPSLEDRIEDFKELSSTIGKEKVIWRYDPLLLSHKIDIESLVERVETVGDVIHEFTDRLVISFVDLRAYRKLSGPSAAHGLRELTPSEMERVAERISELNGRWGLEMFTCGEKVDLERYGIRKGRCVDGDLLLRLFPCDQALSEHLKDNNKKDNGQREACCCVSSKDIGEYNTCPHLCVYCYANRSRQTVIENLGSHNKNPLGETITGRRM